MRNFNFYVVPTPIGNIQDITIRALDVLNNVDVIACEDTRVTQKLLNHYDIRTKCISYHKYNEHERVELLLKILNEGKKIALVSDAGTPMICDPGNIILKELIKKGYSVTSLPGACAVTTFLSQIPRENEEFVFIGFIPRTEIQIKEIIEKYVSTNLIFYESPERIIKTLKVVQDIRGDIEIALGRELSKLFEDIRVDKISKVLEYYKDGIKGEIVCMVYADTNTQVTELNAKIRQLKTKGYSDKDISVIISTLFNVNKNQVYKQSLALSE